MSSSTVSLNPRPLPLVAVDRPPLNLLRPSARPVARPAPRQHAAPVARPGWLERLAAWADRQPMRHHRLGAWERPL